MRTTIFLLFVFTGGCSSKDETKTLDFGKFTMQTPSAWQPVKEKGIDSYVGRVALTDGDTISFDFGWYSNSLEEDPPFDIDGENVYLLDESKSSDTSTFHTFYGKADTVDVDKLFKNKIEWTVIDGRRAKLIQAKMPGDGMTGVYFDSVRIAGSGVDRLQMNGRNLKTHNQVALLKAFRTLKFK